jgi:ABC-2 type transport system ATP-binding protein
VPNEGEPMTTITDEEPDRAASGVPSIEARGVTKRFGDEHAVRDLDLSVEPGTILGLIGPSGCGKTTSVRLMCGLLAPTDGDVRVDGVVATELSARDRERLGYLPQTPALFPDLSLLENLSFHASMYGLPFRRRGRLDEVLEWVELREHASKRVEDASGGMQRRLALAAAFVHDPEILFLDEPTAGIDPILRERLWDRFRAAADDGKTLVVTTQYVGEAGQCDLVGLLSDGELLMLDTPPNLRRAAYSGEVVDVELDAPLVDADLERLQSRDDVVGEVERTGPTGIRLVTEDAGDMIQLLPSVLEGFDRRVVEIDEHLVDYDEAFVQIVQRHRAGQEEHVDPSDEQGATDEG